MSTPEASRVHRLSVVIPVYQGEHTLTPLIRELAALTKEQRTLDGHLYRVDEIILVHDGAIDRSDRVMTALMETYPFVKAVWLSRNFGQHPATLAGIASTTGQWVATLDEDGQQNPMDLGMLLDTATREDVQLVYAKPSNPPPHGWARNVLSAFVKWIFVHVLGNRHIGSFNSYRLIDGEIARSLAAYCGHSVYLDVALSWVVARAALCPILVRREKNHRSGYSLSSLLGHFWRMLLTSGTRPLRFITILGMLAILCGLLITAYAFWMKFRHEMPVQGWASTVSVVAVFSGSILFALGIIAEYLAVSLNIVMGKPLYLIVSGKKRISERP